jgi:hypothetical protein
MQFSEDDLRSALHRKDPGPEFTQRVMARLNQRESSAASSDSNWWQRWFAGGGWRPAVAGALAAILLAIGAWTAIQRYVSYTEQVRNQKIQEQIRAHQAEQQAIRALRITSAKLNHVFQKVNGPSSQEPRIRRQTL